MKGDENENAYEHICEYIYIHIRYIRLLVLFAGPQQRLCATRVVRNKKGRRDRDSIEPLRKCAARLHPKKGGAQPRLCATMVVRKHLITKSCRCSETKS